MYTEWEIGEDRQRPELRVSMADVQKAVGQGKEAPEGKRVQILDARASVQFTGEFMRPPGDNRILHCSPRCCIFLFILLAFGEFFHARGRKVLERPSRGYITSRWVESAT